MALEYETRKGTACPLDCFDACGLVATVRDGRVTKVTGDDRHPITRGFACVKAQRLVQRANSPTRLLHPLRKTPQGWRPIS
jgi:anaerobic selenocysteine-containing dehydrogenase